MSYESALNLGLDEQPDTVNQELFIQMVPVYNSIHLLNQYIYQVSKNLDSGGPEKKPYEAMRFTRWFYTPAADKIKVGQIVTIVNGMFGDDATGLITKKEGAVLGAPIFFNFRFITLANPPNRAVPGTGLVGVALNDCEVGDLCKVGVGPAILKAEGVEAGDVLLTFTHATINIYPGPVDAVYPNGQDEYRGTILNRYPQANPTSGVPVVIGYGVAKDSAFIYPQVDWHATELMKTLANPVPPQEGSGGSE